MHSIAARTRFLVRKQHVPQNVRDSIKGCRGRTVAYFGKIQNPFETRPPRNRVVVRHFSRIELTSKHVAAAVHCTTVADMATRRE